MLSHDKLQKLRLEEWKAQQPDKDLLQDHFAYWKDKEYKSKEMQKLKEDLFLF